MARPTKYNEEIAARIVSFVTAGASREDSAQACGIDSATFYRWMQAHPKFSDRVHEADSTAAIVAERGVYKKNPLAWLQAKRPKVWGRQDNRLDDESAHRLDALVDAMTSAAKAVLPDRKPDVQS